MKTTSPEKTNRKVSVKGKGHFERLLIVRIDPELSFRGLLIDQKPLQGAGEGGQRYRARFPASDEAGADQARRE